MFDFHQSAPQAHECAVGSEMRSAAPREAAGRVPENRMPLVGDCIAGCLHSLHADGYSSASPRRIGSDTIGGDSRNAVLGTIHMPFNRVTNKHLVWCIHILAYVFSLLVLAVSAFSHSSGFYLMNSAKTGGNTFVVYICSGEFFFVRQWDFPFPREFDCGFCDLDVWPAIKSDLSRQSKDFELLRFARHSGINCTIYFGILQSFLLLPMAWLSGFYLFKLRRHFRARHSDTLTY